MSDKSTTLEGDISKLVRIACSDEVPVEARAASIFEAYKFLPLVKDLEIHIPLGGVLEAVRYYTLLGDSYRHRASLIAERAGVIREAIKVYEDAGEFEEAEALARKYGLNAIADRIKINIPEKKTFGISRLISEYYKPSEGPVGQN